MPPIRKVTAGEKSLVANIDSGVKNKWNYKWLEEKKTAKVMIHVDGKKFERTVEMCVGDSIVKGNAAGAALCEWCRDKPIMYGGKGKAALFKHIASDKHMEILKTKLTTPSLGSFGHTVSKQNLSCVKVCHCVSV